MSKRGFAPLFNYYLPLSFKERGTGGEVKSSKK
jgi:hypothetical protein